MTEAAQGGTARLDAFFKTPDGSLTDAVTNPLVSIRDRTGTVVVTDAVPTHIGLGHWEYVYAVAADALLGEWQAEWSGVVDGATLESNDPFEVVPAGSITFVPAKGLTCTPWATSADALAPCNTYAADESELDLAMVIATDVLFELTRRKFTGVCSDVIRPVAQYRKLDQRPPAWWPVVGGLPRSRWGWCSCNRTPEYGCASVPQIRLPRGPVVPGSVEVKINGAAFTDFAVIDRRKLIRTDGDGWPCCQDLRLPDTEDRTWSVTWDYGVDPPPGGARSAAVLGCELYAAFHPESGCPCNLPKRVTTISRQGVTMAILDPLTLFKDGLTGLPSVDLWVASVLLGDKRRRPAMMVPGRLRSGARRS